MWDCDVSSTYTTGLLIKGYVLRRTRFRTDPDPLRRASFRLQKNGARGFDVRPELRHPTHSPPNIERAPVTPHPPTAFY